MQQSFTKEFIFQRFIGILVMALIAFGTSHFLNKNSVETSLDKIERISDEASIFSRDWLDSKIEKGANLSENPLIVESFLGRKSPDLRSTLYSTSLREAIKPIYIYSFNDSTVIESSAGAPSLNSNISSLINSAALREESSLVYPVLFDGKTQVMVASAVRGELGQLLGYTIYFQNISAAMVDFVRPVNTKDVQVDLYRREKLEHVFTLPNIASMPGQMVVLPKSFSDLPVFERRNSSGIFNDTSDIEIVASFREIPNHPNWSVSVKRPLSEIQEENANIKDIVKISAAIISLVILLLPLGSGEYAQTLRRIYGMDSDPLQRSPSSGGFRETFYSPESTTNAYNSTGNQPPSPQKPMGFASEEAKKLALVKKKNEEARKAQKQKHFNPSDSVIAYNIRTGIKHKRLKLLYQPIVDTHSNETAMYEVYLRIIDEEGEVLPPNLWLPVAHKENLLGEIDEAVVNLALENNFFNNKPLTKPLAFNIAGNTFESLSFLENLMMQSTRGIDLASHAIFELRSREIIEDRKAVSFIKECREMGFRFSIDYFGGGPQTLKAAKTLKFDYVKLDALSFDLSKKEEQKEMIRLVKTAEAIKLPLIVEKIETMRILEFCKKLNSPYVQGYHIAKPESFIPEKDKKEIVLEDED